MRIAIDTGGTFTDCVLVRNGKLEIIKVPSTTADPAEAIANSLKAILANATDGKRIHELDLVCGTTVGTNALLQRRGGRVALVTTAGFEDIIEIGRQARPKLYEFFVSRPEPLVPTKLRFGLRERVGCDGRILERPSKSEIARAIRNVERTRPDAVAVCLLFSYINPVHERILAKRLRQGGFLVSVSHEILPEFREFERTATTVVNAYLSSIMSRYLSQIRERAAAASRARRLQVRIMQSSGGIISATVAAREPVRTILSGPAGGILGAQYVAQCSGFQRIISFDMGGTSTDVSLLEGELRTTNEASVAELPVAVPVLDIHTVGAGGGSIARFDRAGALRVGPESAGADPGPICYGRGELPTVTDAHLILGRLNESGLLGGQFRLDEARTQKWMRHALSEAPRSLRFVHEFAQGIVDVANATMEKAIRVVSIERGYDPRDYSLVAFGGAGGLHACDLAVALEMPRVLIPKFPGGLSALGILRADVVKTLSQTVRMETVSAKAIRLPIEKAFIEMEKQGIREMRREGYSAEQIRIERLLDIRYVGQSYELSIPAAGDFVRAFHREHEKRYGYSETTRPVEIINIRARVIGSTPKPKLPRFRVVVRSSGAAEMHKRKVMFGGRWLETRIFNRDKLRAGMRIRGPAIITEYSATTVVPPRWKGHVDAVGNIVLVRQ